MDAAPSTTPPVRRSRYVVAAGLALLVAAGGGLLATLARPDSPWLAFTVFTACLAAPAWGLAWFVLVAPSLQLEEARAEENVERAWAERAAAGTLVDVVVAAGLALTVVSVASVEVSGKAVMLAVVVGALADSAVRYVVLARRGS